MSERIKTMYCAQCGRFLGKEDIRDGLVQIKCPHCKNWNAFVARRGEEPFTDRKYEIGTGGIDTT